MSFYERFEQVVALVLSFLIAIIIVIALLRLTIQVLLLIVNGTLDPLDFKIFQGLFGMIMTLLIAMEFKHSIIRVVHRKVHIIQVKTVLMIAQLALARKFIILDLKTTSALEVFSLGFVVLVLAIAHWLLRERDRAEFLDAEVNAGSGETAK
ncbi:MAG: phosphate-starvation-inducible PsiE family protein [Aestuariibacter sp.]|nr:phosphate-starvation-inducible PsiE family protein [Aestuariibacter sp.]MCP4237322.1 phosphate-starvation-inducible PsiE family protein [Aestuariibacter sp.]